ncbi:MAG: hypothetical protein A3J28_18890 [Acidobacteria bacterium RIFCSPLOWO2_12_FULL_60_22]|nr:MAG: hypothetical protein A3J28_18890 [Acidobacteria bacterium RIFCSPLOWO2_12_FULL_60_22]
MQMGSGERALKRLIVNADDFGYTRGVNRAILEACRNGVVTSTSLLANGPAFEDAVEIARGEQRLDVGCHLNFVEGRPVSPAEQVPHLVAADGRFWNARQLAIRLLRRAVPAIELEREASAQLEKLLHAGLRPSHVDTHKHTHIHPRVADAVARAARRFGVGWIRRPFENWMPRGAPGSSLRRLGVSSLRWFSSGFERRMAAQGFSMPDFFTGIVLTGRLTKQAFAETVAALQPGVTELMCHPGYCDAELEESTTRLKRERELERETVTDGTWQARLREGGVVLTRFAEMNASRELTPNPLPAVPAPALRE